MDHLLAWLDFREGDSKARRSEPPDSDIWSDTVDLAVRHRLAPLLARKLHRTGADLPPNARNRLDDAVAESSRRALLVYREWTLISDALVRAGIPHFPYKGPAMALRLYGDVAMRPASDLDVFVDPDRVDDAWATLESMGLRLAPEITPEMARVYRARGPHVRFQRGPGWPAVELHWRLAPASFGFGALEAHAARAGLGLPGGLPDEELMLVLCLHGAKHAWCALGWLGDVATLGARLTPAQWTRVSQLADALHFTRGFLLGVGLADELFGMPLPEWLAERVNTTPALDPLRAHCRAAIVTATEPELWSQLWFYVRLDPRPVRVARFALSMALGPQPGDIEAFRLPPRLRFLYPLLRPFRLLWRYSFRAAASRLLQRPRDATEPEPRNQD